MFLSSLVRAKPARVVSIGRTSWLSLRLVFGIGFVLALAGCVSANPVVVRGDIRAAESGIYQLFLFNLPVDMLIFSAAFLLVLWGLKAPVWRAPKDANRLVALVILAGIAIAVLGAFIDFYGLYESNSWVERWGVSGHITISGYWLIMSTENIAITAAGVFASVYAVSLLIARLRLIPSLVPASALTAFNLIAWTLLDDPIIVEKDMAATLAGVMFLFVPPVIFGIVHLRKTGEVGA